MTVDVYDCLDQLPYFNPDLDGARLPASVLAFRQRVGAADGIIISSPEYAHGISGLTKMHWIGWLEVWNLQENLWQ